MAAVYETLHFCGLHIHVLLRRRLLHHTLLSSDLFPECL